MTVDRKLLQQIQTIARDLSGLNKRLNAVERTPQMRYTSWTGSQTIFDENENPRQILGVQEDGTYTITEVNAPPPPSPTAPLAESVPGGIRLTWDGTFENDEPRPLDLNYVELHASASSGFTPSPATQVAAFSSQNGGEYFYSVDAMAGPRYFRLVAVNNSDAESVPSPQSTSTATVIVTETDGIVPPQVTGVVVDGGIRSIALSWTLVSNPDQTWYNVYGSTDSSITTSATYFLGRTAGNRFTVYSIYDTVSAQMVNLGPDGIYYFLVTAEDGDGPGPDSTLASGSPTLINSPDIAVNAVTADQIQANAVTADKLEVVLALATTIMLGADVILNTEGMTVTNADGTQTTIRGNNTHLAGTAELNETDINGGLTINDSDNYLNGTLKLSDGFKEPTARPTVNSYRKAIKITTGVNYDRRGLYPYDIGGGTWITTDNVFDNGNIQTWQRNGGGTSFFGISQTGFDMKGGAVRVAGDKFFALGHWKAHSDEWWIRRFPAAGGSYEAQWPITGLSSSQKCALGYDETSGILLVYRVGSTGGSVVEKWNTNGTSAGSAVTGPTWNIDPTGVYFGNANGLFAANRWVFASLSGGVRVYSTSMTRVTSEEWPQQSGTCRGLYFDGTKFWGFDGVNTFEYTAEPGGVRDFAFAYVDNDPAGLGTAVSLCGNRLSYSVPRFAFTSVSVPKPPDAGNTDDPNTIAIYCGTSGGTLYRQSILPTSPSVGGTPTTFVQEYAVSLGSTSTPAVTVSGFAGRTAPLAGSLESAVTDVGGPMNAIRGNAAWRLGEAAGDTNGKMIQSTTSVSITDGSYTGSISLTKVAGIVYANIAVSRASGFSTSFHTIGTIPSGWRPPVTLSVPSSMEYGGGMSYTISVTSAGVVQIRETAATSLSMALTVSWIAT